jgi:hypothetical protein
MKVTQHRGYDMYAKICRWLGSGARILESWTCTEASI